MPDLSASSSARGLAVLGSTGSIGTQTLEVAALYPDAFQVEVLTANRSAEALIQQARTVRPSTVVVADPEAWTDVRDALADTDIRVLQGEEGLCEAVTSDAVDVVVAAVVGAAGLPPVLAAIDADKQIALANKETLVMAGALVNKRLLASNADLVPVDSEHSAIFQCLAGEPHDAVEQLILTASGGPFRTRDRSTFDAITPGEALKHPNWSMGAKITIDSATLMNKGLEVIEAHWMFHVPADRLEVLVHPQSIIHSMVTFVDGSTKAQLGVPDMKVPIQYALTYPDRWEAPHERLDWSQIACLDFEQPDMEAFPCLRLAFDVLEMGGTAPAVLNAANEAAVARFLEEDLRFTDIPRAIEAALEQLPLVAQPSLEDYIELDGAARTVVQELNPATYH